MPWSFTTPTKNARADAITTYAQTGAKLAIFTAAYGTKLAEWTWAGNTFSAAVSGVLTANTPAAATVAGLANGTAAIARLSRTDGTTHIIVDLTVGTSGADVIVSNTSIASGQNCTLNSFTITEA